MTDINLLTGIFPTGQLPLDSKRYVKTLAELSDLGLNDHKAYYYYDRLRVLCLEDDKEYVWREETNVGEIGGTLATGYTYPAGAVSNEIDYGGKTFNFFIYTSVEAPIVEQFGAVWTGVAFNFDCYADPYIISGQVYSTSPAVVTLGAPPVTVGEKRKDAIVVDINGNFVVVPGTESESPEDPDIDESTQKLITIVLVEEGDTIPFGFTAITVYDENTGEPNEWTGSDDTGGQINFAAITNPSLNSIHIEGTAVDEDSKITFLDAEPSSFVILSSLSFRLETPNEACFLSVQFKNGLSNVSNVVNVYPGQFGYGGAGVGYQAIGIPMNNFSLIGDVFNSITIQIKGNNPTTPNIDLIRFDDIKLVYGGDPGNIAGSTWLGLSDTEDTDYANKQNYAGLVNPLQNALKLSRIPLFTDLYKGNVVIVGDVDFVSGLTRRVWATLYIIDTEVYNTLVEGEVTHDASDADPRWDIYYIERLSPTATPTVGIKKGVPDVNPEKPNLDNPIKQVKVGEKLFLGGEGPTPPEVTKTLIYDENLGQAAEWDFDDTSVSGTVPNATFGGGSYSGAVHIGFPGTNIIGSPFTLTFGFNYATPIVYDQTNGSLTFALRFISSIGTGARVNFNFVDSANGLITPLVNLDVFQLSSYGFDNLNPGNWHVVSIPSTAFGFVGNQFDGIFITFNSCPKGSLDLLEYTSGVIGTPPTGVIQRFLDLLDVIPNTYSGNGGKRVIVRPDLTGLDFETIPEVLIKVSANDTNPAYLYPKFEAGNNILITEINDGGNETIRIEAANVGERKRAVIDVVDDTLAPPTEVLGDRYILDFSGGANADWDGANAGDIVEFDGSVWVKETPLEGWRAYVDLQDVDYIYVDDGIPAWEQAVPVTATLQLVTEAGNVTTLNIDVLSVNDLILFAQTGIDVDNIGIGINALGSNIGLNVVAIGTSSMQNNTGNVSTAVGYQSLMNNSGGGVTGFGYLSLKDNKGGAVSAIGHFSGEFNAGATVIAIGSQSAQYNIGDNSVMLGNSAGNKNAGNNSVNVGVLAGFQNDGENNSYLGYKAGWAWREDSGNLKNVADASTDIDIVLNRVKITAHGFGSIGDKITLKYTTTGTTLGGWSNGQTYPAEIIDVNTIEFPSKDITSIGTDTHTFTPQFRYNNVTVLGANAEPTKSNQFVLGDANVTEVVMGNGDVIYPQPAAIDEIGFAASDETTDLVVGPAQLTMRMPYALTLQDIIITVNDGPYGSKFEADIKSNGVSVLSTLVTIDQETESTGTITCLGATVGQTVTINGLVYTAVAGARADDTEFSIDTSDSATGVDLAAAITADVRAGITEPLLDVEATPSGGTVTVSCTTPGSIGNTIDLSSSNGTTLAVSGALLSGGLTEETSDTASVPVVISNSALAKNDEIEVDVTQVGSLVNGTGLKVWLIGLKA